MRKVKIGRYRHYKGKMYEVIGVARHSETLEEMVIYRQLYKSKFPEGTLWVKPKKMFLEKVKVGSQKVPRFKYISEI